MTETFFYGDGDDEIAEYGSGNTPTVIYIPGPAIDEPVAMITGFGGTLTHKYFHTNHQGSVIAMSDDGGAKIEGPYTYDPYGNCFSGSTPCAQVATGEPFRFTGRYLDAETGLYYYRARCYSPTLGRFCQTDPVGYTADLNLYTYGGNDPTNNEDPSGLAPNQVGATDPGVIQAQLRSNPRLTQLNLGSNYHRYFYTDNYGWIDVRHFGEAAGRVLGEKGFPTSPIIIWELGIGVELKQFVGELEGQPGHSGFSYQDLPSNRAGIFSLNLSNFIPNWIRPPRSASGRRRTVRATGRIQKLDSESFL